MARKNRRKQYVRKTYNKPNSNRKMVATPVTDKSGDGLTYFDVRQKPTIIQRAKKFKFSNKQMRFIHDVVDIAWKIVTVAAIIYLIVN